jgi:hypothetical protein
LVQESERSLKLFSFRAHPKMMNIGHGFMVLAIFVGSCAIGVTAELGRLTRPGTIVALAISLVAYGLAFFG